MSASDFTTFITIDEVAERYAVSVSTIRRWCYARRFPAPWCLSLKKRRWNPRDLTKFNAWTRQRSLSIATGGNPDMDIAFPEYSVDLDDFEPNPV